MARSVAAVSEIWTCNFSFPKNESDIHGSWGIVDRKKNGTARKVRLVSRRTHCSSGFLRARMSSPCGTWLSLNTRRTADSLVATRVASEDVEGIWSNFAGGGTSPNMPSVREWYGVAVGIWTRSGPLGRCPDR